MPDAGTQLAKGSSISLEVSDGPANATIPTSIIGATESGARSTLQALGLQVKPRSILANDPKAPYGTVIATNPGAGQTVGLGTEVEPHGLHGQGQRPEPARRSRRARRGHAAREGLLDLARGLRRAGECDHPHLDHR
ncbi:hypothetical protein CTI14_42665, partial [Methylobacterium radiotolerans]